MMKIKVIIVISQLVHGGAETSLLDICKHINYNKIDLTLISILENDNIVDKFKKLNHLKLICFDYSKRLNIRILIDLYRLFKQIKPDIVHTNLPVANIYGRIATIFIKAKLITTIHSVYFKKNIFYLTDLITCHLNDYVIANSEYTKQFLLKYKYIVEKKVKIVKLGLNFEKLKYFNKENNDFIVRYNIPTDAKIITHIGSFKYQKGHHYLIEIAKMVIKKNPHCYFVCAGEGDLMSEIKQLVLQSNLEKNIIFTNNIENVADLLSLSQLFVCTSTAESFGISLLEAMYMKVPVISFDTDAIPELIRDNETGYLINRYNLQDFAEKIEKVLVKNNSQIINNAFYFVKENFEITKTVKNLEEFYSEILN